MSLDLGVAHFGALAANILELITVETTAGPRRVLIWCDGTNVHASFHAHDVSSTSRISLGSDDSRFTSVAAAGSRAFIWVAARQSNELHIWLLKVAGHTLELAVSLGSSTPVKGYAWFKGVRAATGSEGQRSLLVFDSNNVRVVNVCSDGTTSLEHIIASDAPGAHTALAIRNCAWSSDGSSVIVCGSGEYRVFARDGGSDGWTLRHSGLIADSSVSSSNGSDSGVRRCGDVCAVAACVSVAGAWVITTEAPLTVSQSHSSSLSAPLDLKPSSLFDIGAALQAREQQQLEALQSQGGPPVAQVIVVGPTTACDDSAAAPAHTQPYHALAAVQLPEHLRVPDIIAVSGAHVYVGSSRAVCPITVLALPRSSRSAHTFSPSSLNDIGTITLPERHTLRSLHVSGHAIACALTTKDDAARTFSALSRCKHSLCVWDGRVQDVLTRHATAALVPEPVHVVSARATHIDALVETVSFTRPAASTASLPASVMDALRSISLSSDSDDDGHGYDDGEETVGGLAVTRSSDELTTTHVSPASASHACVDSRTTSVPSYNISDDEFQRLRHAADTVTASLASVQQRLSAHAGSSSVRDRLLQAALQCVETQANIGWLMSILATGAK